MRRRLPHLPSFRDLNQITIGLIAMIAIAALLTGVFAYGTVGATGDRYELSAVFTETGGIKTGAEVRLAGVSVGAVTGIVPDFESGQVILTFEVDEGTELGPDTRAEIAAATLLGGFYLRLSGPVVTPFLADGDRIGLDRTTNPLSLIATLSDTTNLVQAIDIESVNAVMAELAEATSRNLDLVPGLLQNLTDIGTAVSAREAQIRSIIGNGQEITAALAARDTELVELIDTATVLLQTLTDRRDELATILGSGSAAVVELSDTIAAHRAAIDSLLADAHTFLDGVDRNLGVINTSLGQAGTLISLLAATSSEQGGFDVAVEGFIGNTEQLGNVTSLLGQFLGSLGLL